VSQRTNYVLIDFESVQPDSLAALDHEHFKLILFVGANQSKLPFEVVEVLQRAGSRAEYVKMAGNGPNALDFHIAFYIGQLAAADPKAFFHIISKDKGFDPLIQHLKSKKIFAGRVAAIADIPLVKVSGPMSRQQRLALVVKRLQQLKTAKPRTAKTLGSTISSLFQKTLPEGEVEALIQALHKHGLIAIENTKVSYALPQEQA